MATTDRAGIVIGGPRGGSEWADMGDSFTLQNHATVSATTTANNLSAYSVTRPNAARLVGNLLQTVNDDALDATQIIQTLYGFQIQASTILVAQSTLTLSLSAFRTIGTLGVAITGGVAITSVTLAAGMIGAVGAAGAALPSGSVFTVYNAAGNSQAFTTSAAVNVGATLIPVNSVTPANSYALGNPASWQVGNQAAFGWLAAGGGTPLLPPGVTVLAPGLTGNTSLIVSGGSAAGTVGNSALPLCAGDSLVFTLVTSSGSVTVPICNIQPLIT